ncbi:MAG: histidinol dehydrogenase [Cyclobacteriaceae bacterium]|nr:histidinol dehydrogenase [Cyclobacteriaceae bacterium HetDA_MAG_MS6]
MQIYVKPKENDLIQILRRPSYDLSKVEKIVDPILDKVKRGGDRALRKFALEYDHVELQELWVSEEELARAEDQVPKKLRKAIKVAKENIWKFHGAQRTSDLDMEVIKGINCSRKSVPIQRVGLYVPGGSAPLFSTVLMLGIPAIIAGCEEIILSTPTNRLAEVNAVVLYTAGLLGIKKILKVGGAQAIAAMAYGTETVSKVDKIFGPGNQYVTVAKQLVAKDMVAIDMPAGPSEVLVFVDKESNAAFAAADLLSQAEHGVDSQVILVSTSKKKAEEVSLQIEEQLKDLPRKDIAKEALKFSAAIVVEDREAALDIINKYGPEHLILSVSKPEKLAAKIVNAGSVFVGEYTPESAGDYASGTNHTLPTNGWARSYSGVSLDSFYKKITFQQITPEGLRSLGPHIETMAEAEQLEGHKNAVTIRLKHLS